MSYVMKNEPVAVRMVDRERGDLFAICLSDRSLIVQMIESLPDADTTRNVAAPGVFAVTEDKPEELWLRLYTHDKFTRCQYLPHAAPCPTCGNIMKVVGEQFVCSFCTSEQLTGG